MKTWSFYDERTGLFTGRLFSGADRHLRANTRAGSVAIEGRHDKLTQRVDVDTGEILVYECPRDEIDAEQRRLRVAAANLAIEALERNAQPRAVREALLALLPDGPEKSALKAIDDQISTKRVDLLDP